MFLILCLSTSILTGMEKKFPIDVSVLDETSKGSLNELIGESLKLSQTLLTAKTNYNLREVLPSTQWVIMGWTGKYITQPDWQLSG